MEYSKIFKNMAITEIPDKIAKNQFLFLASFILVLVAVFIINKVDSEYINLGFITFLYFYVLFLINLFFMKVIYKEKPKNHNRWTEFILSLLSTILWLFLVFNFIYASSSNYTPSSFYNFSKDFITLILTTAGIIIAGMGLSTWRKQIKGSKEFKTAYNLNYSLLRLRNAIKYVRHPAIWPSEQYKAAQYFKDKYPEKMGTEEEQNGSDAYVYEMRWEKITQAYEKMESHLLAVEVLWGSEILEKIKPLKKKVNELSIMLKQNFASPDFRTHSQKEIRDIIYDTSSENGEDKFSEDINNTIKEIVDYIKQTNK